jgi:hypothetical protein
VYSINIDYFFRFVNILPFYQGITSPFYQGKISPPTLPKTPFFAKKHSFLGMKGLVFLLTHKNCIFSPFSPFFQEIIFLSDNSAIFYIINLIKGYFMSISMRFFSVAILLAVALMFFACSSDGDSGIDGGLVLGKNEAWVKCEQEDNYLLCGAVIFQSNGTFEMAFKIGDSDDDWVVVETGEWSTNGNKITITHFNNEVEYSIQGNNLTISGIDEDGEPYTTYTRTSGIIIGSGGSNEIVGACNIGYLPEFGASLCAEYFSPTYNQIQVNMDCNSEGLEYISSCPAGADNTVHGDDVISYVYYTQSGGDGSKILGACNIPEFTVCYEFTDIFTESQAESSCDNYAYYYDTDTEWISACPSDWACESDYSDGVTEYEYDASYCD